MVVTRSLELVLSVAMPATRSYEAILKEMDDQVERLSDDGNACSRSEGD